MERRSLARVVLGKCRRNVRLLLVFLMPICLSPLLFVGGAEWRCAYAIVLLSAYWVIEAVPLAVTALVPIFLLPALNVNSVKSVASSYLNDTNFLFVSSLMMSLAIEKCNLHRRVALRLLMIFGAKPQWLIAGFMCVTSFISLWISDTACAALMTPIAYALLEAVMASRMISAPMISLSRRKDVIGVSGAPTSQQRKPQPLDMSCLSERDRSICKCIMLMVAHASLIGGTGTINSTGPNLVLRDNLESNYNGKSGITYLTWMAFAIPPMLGYMLASFLCVQWQFLGVRHLLRLFYRSSQTEAEQEKVASAAVQGLYEELGPISFAEKSVLFLFTTCIGLWITSDPRVFPGWVQLFPRNTVSDTSAGMLICFVMFLWPARKPSIYEEPDADQEASESKHPKRKARDTLLTWDLIRTRFPWSIILLLGAGFAISASVKKSGLGLKMACQLEGVLSPLSPKVRLLVLSVFVVAMTEFTTNTATASILIPIALALAEQYRMNPLYFGLPTAIGPSFSFMLPMATSSNAIVYETGVLTMWDMVSTGLVLNVLCIGITWLNMNTWTWWLFNLQDFPVWAADRNATIQCPT